MIKPGLTRRSMLSAGAATVASLSVARVPAAPRMASLGASGVPALGIEALGHLNRFHTIARQLPGDWSGMGIEAVVQDGDDGFHMQLPYMAYALAVVQHGRTPAYRELYKASIDGLIQKMRRNEVWDYWEDISTGEAIYGPEHRDMMHAAEADPLKQANVMYSGHILPLLALYEMFYGDRRWTAPGSFALSRMNRAGNLERFAYDLDSVHANTVRQLEESGYLGLECFRDAIFPTTCNQFPLHGLIHYDALRGTRTAPPLIDKHVAAWKKISTLYDRDRLGEAPFVFHPSRHAIGLSDAVAFGKAQFINVYAGEYVRAAYPRWRERLFTVDSSGILTMNKVAAAAEQPIEHEQIVAPRKVAALPAYLTGSNEQLAHKVPPAALELGDVELAVAGYRFVEQHNPAIWRDGELFYDRNDSHGTPRFLNRRASILLASGRVWSKNAYQNLYARPWGQSELNGPEVQGVDYPNVLVSQAFHDAASDVLTVTILPHGLLPDSRRPRAVETSFRVVRLNAARRYRVRRDGAWLASPADVAQSGGTLSVRTRLDGTPQTFEVIPA